MLTNYFTLRALVREWEPILAGSQLLDAYSQHKGSLVLVFTTATEDLHSINLSVQSPDRHLFRYDGSNRSRRNVVDHFPRLRSRHLVGIQIAEGDRLITWEFDQGVRLLMIPFGGKANAFLVDENGSVMDTFKGDSSQPAPEAQPATMPQSVEDVRTLLKGGREVGRLWPLFSGPLRDELLHRVDGLEDPKLLVEAATALMGELESPTARIYQDEDGSPTLSLVPLHHLGSEAELFDTVDTAVRIYARRRLAQNRFEGAYKPLLQAIRKRHLAADRSLSRVEKELSRPERSEHYEHLGHLMMAQLHLVEDGAEVTQLPDLLGDGSMMTIRLNPELTPVENAQRMYEKAKSSRAAREVAMERLGGLTRQVQKLTEVLEEVKSLSDVAEVKTFKNKHAALLATLQQTASDQDTIPYRRFELSNGYEVWVGRNARQNDELTLRDARPFDVWLHARGVAGSHTVLRVKGRTDSPPKQIIEQAASIAAWFSKARTSSLAPVIVTQRKYVRKPRKSVAGSVRVDREEVLLVEPRLPD